MNCLGFGILIYFCKSVAPSKIAHLLFTTTSNSRLSISIALYSTFAMPSPTPLWIAILPPTLLWIVVFPPQQHFPPMHPSALPMFSQNIAPQLHLQKAWGLTIEGGIF
jgi:hypothetical protein